MATDFNDTPDMSEPGVSQLQESILILLEDAEIDTATNDAIMKLIQDGETRHAQSQVTIERIFCGRCNEYESVANSCARQYGYI